MGNNIGCCRRGLDGIEDFDFKNSLFPAELANRTVSTTNLLDNICVQPSEEYRSFNDLSYIQHISDREPENEDIDPSLNISISSGFLTLDLKSKFSNKYRKHDMNNFDINSKFSLVNESQSFMQYRQNQTYIHAFLKDIFHNAQLGPECAICALILFERLITSCELAVLNWTWRRQLFICIVISSKILDDQAIWNADYCQILKDVSVEDLNYLERHALQLLQFNINIDRSIYIKYVFELMALSRHVGLEMIDFTERRLLDSNLAAQLTLVNSSLKRDRGTCHGDIFDISFPHTTRMSKQLISTKKTHCDMDLLHVKSRPRIKVDQIFLENAHRNKKSQQMLEDLAKLKITLPKNAENKAEQVASITSSTQKHQVNSSSAYCRMGDSQSSDEKITTTTMMNSGSLESSTIMKTNEIDEFDDDYKFILLNKGNSIKSDCVNTSSLWSKVNVEFF